eukprot:TRINITY_DN63325_c0_g1_i1.p1 TRINITY_DN63325_c0_g1~~TRINITY_DN63325_c0_g1_i1.p1  ORF type:complete len:1207 (-),score=166.47 TRINITY_DN63325_c0_g1_i1:115-3735(-)
MAMLVLFFASLAAERFYACSADMFAELLGQTVARTVDLPTNAAVDGVSLEPLSEQNGFSAIAARTEFLLRVAAQLVGAFCALFADFVAELIAHANAHPSVMICFMIIVVTLVGVLMCRSYCNDSWHRDFEKQTPRSYHRSFITEVPRKHLDESDGVLHSDLAMPADACLDDSSDEENQLGGASGSTGGVYLALGRCPLLRSLGRDCLDFLAERSEVLNFQPGDSVFEHGTSCHACLVVMSGKVTVTPGLGFSGDSTVGGPQRTRTCVDVPMSDAGCSEQYDVGEGDQVVGLLCTMGSLGCTEESGAFKQGDGYIHDSSAMASGEAGAEVIAIPSAVLGQAFDRFPAQMRSLAYMLTVRAQLVIFEVLFVYFGLVQEVFKKENVIETSKLGDDAVAPAASWSDLSPSSAFARAFGIHALDDQDGEKVETVLKEATVKTFSKGEIISLCQERSSRVLVLLEGEVEAEGTTPGQPSGVLIPALRIRAGDLIGATSVLTKFGGRVTYRAVDSCRFSCLGREQFEKFLELRPRASLGILRQLVSRVGSWLHRVDAAVEWVHLKGGDYLYKADDPQRGFFMVLSGHLLCVEETESSVSEEKVSACFRRGQCCGQLECHRDVPYAQSVQAARDMDVCRIPPFVLKLICANFPQAMLHATKHFSSISSHAQMPISSRRRGSITTIAVIPATASVPVSDICANLTKSLGVMGKTLHLSSGDLVWTQDEGTHSLRVTRFLADMEARSRWLVYEAEAARTAWTRRCIRQADLIIIAVCFDGGNPGDVPQSNMELYVESIGKRHVPRELLVLHLKNPFSQNITVGKASNSKRPGLRRFITDRRANTGRLRSTRNYLITRPWARTWYHVREEVLGDWRRCARLIVGNGIGLCLGGGGARGAAHVGVVRALRDLNIPIDVVSGTSFGAFVGAIYAATAEEDLNYFTRFVVHIFSKKYSTLGMLMDLTYPRTAKFTGAFINYLCQQAFARRRCEDLLVPFSCTTTDILNLQPLLHRQGPLWRIVRGSMSLVGLLPPLPHIDVDNAGQQRETLLVDGGYTNQYPVEELHDRGAGAVIRVAVASEYQQLNAQYGSTVSGTAVSLRQACSCRRRAPGADPPSLSEIEDRLIFLVDQLKQESTDLHTDLFLKMPVQNYSFLEFDKYKELDELGYAFAKPLLQEWLSSKDGAAASCARTAVQSELDEHQPSRVRRPRLRRGITSAW